MVDLEQILIKAINDELQLRDVTSLCEEIRELRQKPDAEYVEQVNKAHLRFLERKAHG